MEIFGSLEVPKSQAEYFQEHDAQFVRRDVFLIALVALFGGWIGYWIVATLFHG